MNPKPFKIAIILLTLVFSVFLTLLQSTPAYAAPDFQDVVLSGSPASGVSSTLVGDYSVEVVSTWGTEGGWSDGHYAGLGVGFFNNVGTFGDNSEAWVRWTFDSPVTSIRVYYGDMEAPILDFGDPTSFIANIGGNTVPIDLRDTGSGGYRVGSSAMNAWNEGIFGSDGVISCGTSPCGGWIELNIPQGVSFVEARSSTSNDAGWNEVGIAVDVNAPFATQSTPATTPAEVIPAPTQSTLPETGTSVTTILVCASTFLAIGFVLLMINKRRVTRT